jgi:hypothetical protein
MIRAAPRPAKAEAVAPPTAADTGAVAGQEYNFHVLGWTRNHRGLRRPHGLHKKFIDAWNVSSAHPPSRRAE